MKSVNASELAPLRFTRNEPSQKVRMTSNKIGWVESLTENPGASFDFTIKDALGRLRYERRGCSSETEKYGERINFETMMGEDLEITVENLQGAESIDLFLN